MRNHISCSQKGSRSKKAKRLLETLEADIVSPDGNFPEISIERIASLLPGGSIYLSAQNSPSCWLETDSDNVSYSNSNQVWPAHIIGYYHTESKKKYVTKTKDHRFIITLAGIRPKSD